MSNSNASFRKRTGSGSNKKFKEKVLQMYETLFQSNNVNIGECPENFWNEFFLLKPKVHHLESEILKLCSKQLMEKRESIRILFHHSLKNLADERNIKVVYALQTLCGLFKAIFKRFQNLCQSCEYDLASLFFEYDEAEEKMQTLISHINSFLCGDDPASLKDLCLKLLLVIATGVDNVSQNALLEYLMVESIFESLVFLLSHADTRGLHGYNVVLLLTILVQYRKYDSTNPYVVKLSILDQELALLGYGQVITSSLTSFTKEYETSLINTNSASTSWLTSLTSIVGNMFVSDDGNGLKVELFKERNPMLLALYEAIHLNRNFIVTLAHYQTGDNFNDGSNPPPPAISKLKEDAAPPSNLLVTFLEYFSLVMQDTKSDFSCSSLKLNFLILICVTEDQYANALMHDSNLVFRVNLYRAPMRHRNPNIEAIASSRPLACAVLDLMVEFIRSHMMKRFPNDLYLHSLSVIHRILAYQKRLRMRLNNYSWKELWSVLMSLLKFITINESSLVKKVDIFAVGLHVIIIFNLFITYGDTFLPSPNCYDELYYEIVRCHSTFDSLYSMALRYNGWDFKDNAVKLTSSLVNIKAITAHFRPKIKAWLTAKELSTPTEEQILIVVKSNYDSLTLKLQDGLDQYERYTETPQFSSFFTTLVQNLVNESRQRIVINDLELQVVLHDFSTIK